LTRLRRWLWRGVGLTFAWMRRAGQCADRLPVDAARRPGRAL